MNPVAVRIFGIKNSKTVSEHFFSMFLTEGEHAGKALKLFEAIEEYYEFCDQDYQSVLNDISVRWLSLERSIGRTLKKYPSLKSYFLSEHFADERFKRLNRCFNDPLLEAALFFSQAAILIFTNFNLLLQREEPTVHILNASMEHLGRKLATRIIKPTALRGISSISDIDLTDDSIFIEPKSIFLGGTTKAILNRLLSEVDISQHKYDSFHTGAHLYFKDALQYIQNKFPIKNEVIHNSVLVDVEKRDKATWPNIEFFLLKYSNQTCMEGVDNDKVFEEFVNYQPLTDDEIGHNAWSEAEVVDGKDEDGNKIVHYRVDILWYYLASMRLPETSISHFKVLPRIVVIVLVLPHSNASLKRLFSIIRKNKTDMQSSLKLDGTLSSILSMKTHNPESITLCFKWRPDQDLLELSREAAKAYNDEHKS